MHTCVRTRPGPSTTSAPGRRSSNARTAFVLATSRSSGAARWPESFLSSARRASSRMHACDRSRLSSTAGPLQTTTGLALQLIEAARDLAVADAGIASVMINTDDRRLEPPEGFVLDELIPRWMVPVPGDLDALRASWRKTSNNLFRSLKKADAAGLGFRAGESLEDLRSFHRMYVRTMKKHRSLPRSLRQLRVSREMLGESFKLFLVSHEGRDIAGGVYHVFGDTVELVYNGSEEAALAMRPNHTLYWEVMQWAAATGLRQVNLGGAERRHSAGALQGAVGSRAAHPLPPDPPGRRQADQDRGARVDRPRRRELRRPHDGLRVDGGAAPAPAPRRSHRVQVRMSGMRAVPVDPEAEPRYDAYVARSPARHPLPARRLGPDPARLLPVRAALPRADRRRRGAPRRTAAGLQEGPGVERPDSLAAGLPVGRSTRGHARPGGRCCCRPRGRWRSARGACSDPLDQRTTRRRCRTSSPTCCRRAGWSASTVTSTRCGQVGARRPTTSSAA